MYEIIEVKCKKSFLFSLKDRIRGEKLERKKKKKKGKDEESIAPDKRKGGGCWLHEKSCYGS